MTATQAVGIRVLTDTEQATYAALRRGCSVTAGCRDPLLYLAVTRAGGRVSPVPLCGRHGGDWAAKNRQPPPDGGDLTMERQTCMGWEHSDLDDVKSGDEQETETQ